MMYPVILHKDEGSAYGITIPDFPGCFTAGDTLEEALANVQEVVQFHLEGQETPPPAPTPIEDVLTSKDARGGAVLMVDIDLSFLEKKAVPVNITMPVYARNVIDRAAKARGMSRSAFIVESALRAAGRAARRSGDGPRSKAQGA